MRCRREKTEEHRMLSTRTRFVTLCCVLCTCTAFLRYVLLWVDHCGCMCQVIKKNDDKATRQQRMQLICVLFSCAPLGSWAIADVCVLQPIAPLSLTLSYCCVNAGEFGVADVYQSFEFISHLPSIAPKHHLCTKQRCQFSGTMRL